MRMRSSPAPTSSITCAAGGYRLSGEAFTGKRTRDEFIKIVSDAGLRGLGGAGFPTGRKWSLVRAEPAPRLIAVNADEGEPGTFKDRYYLGLDPHRFLEGMLIAAWVVEAADTYIYIRDEYPELRLMLADEIAKLERAGLDPLTKIHLRRGAGAYICGEELAMIELIEGKRGLPRHRPPYVAQVGLFGRPTLEQNVETLLLGARHRREGRGLDHLAGPPRAQGLPQLLGFRPGEKAGRGARAGRRHGARIDRRILRRHGRMAKCSRAICRAARRAASCRRRWPTCRSISARWRNTAASSARTRL